MPLWLAGLLVAVCVAGVAAGAVMRACGASPKRWRVWIILFGALLLVLLAYLALAAIFLGGIR